MQLDVVNNENKKVGSVDVKDDVVGGRVDALTASEVKTKNAVALLKTFGCDGKAVLVDIAVDDKLSRSVRNIPGVSFVPSAKLTARAVMNAGRVVATKGALERLQEALA